MEPSQSIPDRRLCTTPVVHRSRTRAVVSTVVGQSRQMTPIDHHDADLEPLTTDALIEQRVASLIGRAQNRQIWLLFVGHDNVQSPLVLPVSDIPVAPWPDEIDNWCELLRGTTEAVDASEVIVVIERYAPDRLTDADKGWARLLRDGCRVAGVALRAVVLSHRNGVRLLAADDYA